MIKVCDALLTLGGAWRHRPRMAVDAMKNGFWQASAHWLLDHALHPQMMDNRGFGATGATRWGWKVPPNAVLWPVFLERFPDARVVMVRRNQEDAARSLVRHSVLCYWQNPTWLITDILRNGRTQFSGWYNTELEGARETWQEYEDVRKALPEDDRVLWIEFEDLVNNPEEMLKKICSHTGLEPDESIIKRLASKMRPDRANAWEKEHGSTGKRAVRDSGDELCVPATD
jgi:hypothetical protein